MEKEWTKENLDLWNSVQMAKAYNGNNYREIFLNPLSDICIIFFSSNGLYYPNTIPEFEKTVIQEDRYEWENHLSDRRIRDYAGKAILVRDVYKQWYVKGISSAQDRVETVKELLSQLVEGYRIITVGSSSGGYAAVLFGLKLGAERIFTFSGQFSIENEVDDYFWLSRYKDDKITSKYYTLFGLLKDNEEIPLYYFYPAKCKQDIEQYDMVKGEHNLYAFAIDCDQHGKTLKNEDFIPVLIMSDQDMIKHYEQYKGILIDKENFLMCKGRCRCRRA